MLSLKGLDIVVMIVKMSEGLANIYFNPQDPGGLGSHRKLFQRAREIGLKVTPDEVKDWLRKQYVYTLHHPARRNFKRNRVIVTSPHDQIQADLVDMQMFKEQNDGVCFLLTCINSFSKKATVVPLRNKTAKSVRDALDDIFSTERVGCLYTDKGSEFQNKLVAKLCDRLNVAQYISENPETKASIVERFNRTLKEKMFRWMTHTGTRRYIDGLQDLVKGYNATQHKTIGVAPDEVTDENTPDIFRRMYKADDVNGVMSHQFRDEQKFAIGNSVRTKYSLKPMDKSYYPMFTDRVYTVRRIIKGDRRFLYKLEDHKHKELPRSFYAEELLLISPDTLYRIEKVIKRKGNKALVKYLNYDDDANEWIDSSAICTVSGNNTAVHHKA